MRIILILTLITIGCANKNQVKIQEIQVFKPQLQYSNTIQNLELFSTRYIDTGKCTWDENPDADIFCITLENAILDIQNYNRIRMQYNDIKNKLELMEEYYEKSQ